MVAASLSSSGAALLLLKEAMATVRCNGPSVAAMGAVIVSTPCFSAL